METQESTEAPFSVDVPDTLADLLFMEKDRRGFRRVGMGYARALPPHDLVRRGSR